MIFPANVLANDIDSEDITLKTVVTAENLKTGEVIVVDKKNIDCNTIENDNSISEEVMADVALPDSNNTINPLSSVIDSGKCCRVKFNVEYTKSGNKYRLDKVSGSYTKLDPAVAITKRHVRYASIQDYKSNKYIKDYKPSKNKFSYAGFKNYVDTKNSVHYIVGGFAECKVTRGKTTWNLRCSHIVVSRDIGISGIL